jgi:phage gp46-like protein
MQNQQGDVKLFQTDNDGEINVRDGLVQMGGGLETAAFLSLFGGNEDDDGLAGNNKTWWGNLDEIDPARQYRSETQNLLRAIPATSGNLRRIEDAAARDLAWFIAERVASSVSVSASIPGVNRIKLTVDIEADGDESRFEFVENWKANV